ncbi:MAG: HNH endonuclease [Candidatus Thorarchaeota archaeon]
MVLKAPSRHVKTIRELIYWYYANLIARAAGFEGNYGFVMSRYKRLKSGEMKWSSTIRDKQKEWEMGGVCAYCEATTKLTHDHIIPSSRAGVDPRVKRLLESADNCVWACKSCNSSKGAHDIFEWYGEEGIDEIPQLVLSKFLKLAFCLHETQGTLDSTDLDMNGVLNIYDLGVVITHLIAKLSGQSSGQW